MNANQKLIQVKGLINQLLQDKKITDEAPPEDILILKDFLAGKKTIASAIQSTLNIRKTQTG